MKAGLQAAHEAVDNAKDEWDEHISRLREFAYNMAMDAATEAVMATLATRHPPKPEPTIKVADLLDAVFAEMDGTSQDVGFIRLVFTIARVANEPRIIYDPRVNEWISRNRRLIVDTLDKAG